MSIEGLWLMRSTEVGNSTNLLAPAIITLETGRLFGGDSAYYYIGNFELDRAEVTGQARVQTHTLTVGLTNVFGMGGRVDYFVDFNAEFDGAMIIGTMWPKGMVAATQRFAMTKLAELP